MTDSTTSTSGLPDSLCRLYDDPDAVAESLQDRAGDPAVAEGVAEICGVLSNPQRVRLLLALRDSECCVCELQTALEAPQSTVATHLRQLTDAGLVTVRKEGKWSYYSVADSRIFDCIEQAATVGEPTEVTE